MSASEWLSNDTNNVEPFSLNIGMRLGGRRVTSRTAGFGRRGKLSGR